MSFRYDGFISYSRRDAEAAEDIERRLERFRLPRETRRRLGRRHLNVFRDESDITGNRLDKALDEHLARSRKLVVLCSPAARDSTYVGREIERFATLRDADGIVPVLIGGMPNNDGASDRSDWAFPEALAQVLAGVPLASDLRLRSATTATSPGAATTREWTRLVADMVDLTPDDLTQRIARDRRRRLWIGLGMLSAVIIALTGLLVWAIRERQEATRQRDRAREQADLATSRQLAASAEDLPAADADLALDLAVAAQNAAKTAQSTDALLTTLTRNPQLLRYLHGTTGFSGVVAVSPGDERAAGGGSDGQLVQWNLDTGADTVFSTSGGSIDALTYSPGGQTILAIRQDVLGDGNAVEAWDAATGQLLGRRSFGTIELDDVAALDESTAIVAGGDEDTNGQDAPGLLSRWRWSDDALQQLPAPRKVSHVTPVAGGLLLAVGNFPNTNELLVVDATTGAVRTTPIALDRGSVNDLDTSADGRLAVATTGDEVLLINTLSGEVSSRMPAVPQAFAVRVVLGGSRLAVWQSTATSGIAEDHAIHLYDVPSLEASGPTIPIPSAVGGLAALHSSEVVLSAREGGGVAVWDVGRGGSHLFSREVADVQLPPSDTAFTPDGSMAISTGPRAAVVARDWDRGQELWRREVLPDGQFVAAAEASPDGTIIAIGGGSFLAPKRGVVVLLEPRSGLVVGQYEVGPTQVRHLAFSADGRFLVAGSSDLLGTDAGAVVALELPSGEVYVLDDSPPVDLVFVGDRLVWATSAGQVSSSTIAEARSGQAPTTVKVPERLSLLAPTARASQVAVSSGAQVGVLDLGSNEPRLTWLGEHRADVSSLAVNPSGTTLVSTDYGGELIFWDLASGRALSTPILLGTSNGLSAVFSPRKGASDLLLVSDAGLRALDGDPSSWVTRACSLANRELTAAEWDRFVGNERPYAHICSPP